jgi:hypothetical protein
MKVSIILALTAVLVALPVAVQAESWDFESYSVGPVVGQGTWAIATGSAAGFNVTDTEASPLSGGTKSLAVRAATAGRVGPALASDLTTGVYLVGYDFKIAAVGTAYSTLPLYATTAGGAQLVQPAIGGVSGGFGDADGLGPAGYVQVPIPGFSPVSGVWYRFEFLADLDAHLLTDWKLYNISTGTKVLTSFSSTPMWFQNSGGVYVMPFRQIAFRLDAGTADQGYNIDNISVTSATYPAPIIAAVTPDPQAFYMPGEFLKQMQLLQGGIVTWSLVGASNPPGLTINSSTGMLSGWTPAAAGLYTITVKATNSVGSDTKSFGVQVNAGAGADDIQTPWGTVDANLYKTQSSDDAKLRFSEAWKKGVKVAWTLTPPDRPTAGITFDEAGNIYWTGDYVTDGKATVMSATPTGEMRWLGHSASGNDAIGWGDSTGVLIGDGGAAGRVYVLGYDYTAGADPSNGYAVAYKKSDGGRVWKTSLPNAYFMGDGNRRDKLAPTLYQGHLYIVGRPYGTDPGPYNIMVYSLNSQTGAIEWSNELAGVITYNFVGTSNIGGQVTLVPDKFGAGKHAIFFNFSGFTNNGPSMYAVQLDTTANTASLAWSSSGGMAARSHVNYLPAVDRVFTTAWNDFGASLYGWNPTDGSFPSAVDAFGEGKHGYFDVSCVDFNGTDLIVQNNNGRIVRYEGITPGQAPSAPVVIYDSQGFESFALGNLKDQDGWATAVALNGLEPQVVNASGGNQVEGNQAVRLEVTGTQGDVSEMSRAISDAIAAGYKVVTVSFDIYRTSTDPGGGANNKLENLWWWWFDAGTPTYGLQWDSGGTRPFGFANGAAEAATIKDRWVNLTQEWDLTNNVAKSWYDGVPVDISFPITDIASLTGWANHLGHESGDPGPEVLWIDNFVITGSLEAGSTGGPASNGYYQLDPLYGELQPQGGLYKDTAGDSILLTGTVGWPGAIPGKVIAVNVSQGTLVSDCTAFTGEPVLIDDFQIVGAATGTYLSENFDGMTLGNMAGQTSTGLDSNGWQDNNSGAGGGPSVAIIDDPTGAGRNHVVSIDPRGSCGVKGIKGLLASPAYFDTITVSWWQYRADLTEDVNYNDQSTNGWSATERGQDGDITPRNGTDPQVWVGPLTAGAWQKVEYVFEYGISTVTLNVYDSGNTLLFTTQDFLDPTNEIAVSGWTWQAQLTSYGAPRTPTIFAYDIGLQGTVPRGIQTGPAIGPGPGGPNQHIYYFETGNYAKRLIALQPACNTPPSDADGDGDVDLVDFGIFQGCFNGPNRPWNAGVGQPGDCACLDNDGDLDVDLVDFGVFQGCFNGPNRPPACQ